MVCRPDRFELLAAEEAGHKQDQVRVDYETAHLGGGFGVGEVQFSTPVSGVIC